MAYDLGLWHLPKILKFCFAVIFQQNWKTQRASHLSFHFEYFFKQLHISFNLYPPNTPNCQNYISLAFVFGCNIAWFKYWWTIIWKGFVILQWLWSNKIIWIVILPFLLKVIHIHSIIFAYREYLSTIFRFWSLWSSLKLSNI